MTHWQTTARLFSLISGFGAAVAIALAPPPISAQSDERPLTIDGTSPASFEASVAALQNDLSQRRREELEIALAVIWTRHTLGSGDRDQDGDVDADDGRVLRDDTTDLLTDIRRGDILSAIEDSETSEYTAADYRAQLDGLGLDAVLDLAGRPSENPYFAALMRDRSEKLCGRHKEQSAVRLKWCDDVAGSAGSTMITHTARALNDAVEALNLQQYADARGALEKLDVNRMSPYEHSKVEQVFYAVASAEEKHSEAREHLQNAIAAGGLSEQEVAAAMRQIRAIEEGQL
jgi:hypothetical protein